MTKEQAILLLSQASNLIFEVEKTLDAGSTVRQEGYRTRIQLNRFKQEVDILYAYLENLNK